jgi:hypothetical protein
MPSPCSCDSLWMYFKSWFTSGASCHNRVPSRPSVLAIRRQKWFPPCGGESHYQICPWSSGRIAWCVVYFESRGTSWPSRSYGSVFNLVLSVNLVFDFFRIGSGKSTLAMSILRFVGWFTFWTCWGLSLSCLRLIRPVVGSLLTGLIYLLLGYMICALD